MIQPQEIRIGNYVFDIDGDVLQIGQILDIGVKFKNTSLSGRYEKINPIPLTEEILLKLGFKQNEQFKTNFKFYLKDNEIEINIYNGNNNSWLNDRYVINLKYVHQLQNLYFALTGEELIFKTTP